MNSSIGQQTLASYKNYNMEKVEDVTPPVEGAPAGGADAAAAPAVEGGPASDEAAGDKPFTLLFFPFSLFLSFCFA